MKRERLTRRQLLQISAMGSAALIAAACTPAAPTAAPAAPAAAEATTAPAAGEATAAPAATAATDATAAPAGDATAAPAANLPPVDRNKQLILGWTLDTVGITNPWAAGYTHQALNNQMWEPLFYYAIFARKEVPWLAESGEYNADFTQLTIKMRPGAEWSDGTPITSKDVKFTFDTQLSNEKLNYHADFAEFVKEIQASDDSTVVVSFNKPAPRFKFEVLSFKFDTGIPIVPEHVISKEADVTAFQGGADIPHSGPYTIKSWDANQKVLDLREDWWATKTGFQPVPEVKRIVVVGLGGIVGGDMTPIAQQMVLNQMDACLDLRSDLIKSTLAQNPKITSWTANEPPYGYLDWWPNSLWMNHQLEPWTDVNVRRALNLSIDRDYLDTSVYEGAKVTTVFPFPLYPDLETFANKTQELQDKYQPRKFDLEESGKLLTAAGFAKNGDEKWEKDGKTIDATIHGFQGIHSDLAPKLEQLLNDAGFEASVDFSADSYNHMANGDPGLYLFGHGASLVDPYPVFFLFNKKPVGNTAGANNFSRYNNPEYTKIVEQMGPLPAEDPKFQELALQAIEYYWKDVIDVPVIQWLHRIPYNQTFWTNWPLASNVGAGINGAFWAHTGLLEIISLKSTGAANP